MTRALRDLPPRATLAASLLLASLAADAGSQPLDAERPAELPPLLRAGTYHGDEVDAGSGERWLGLFPAGSGYELLPCTLRIDLVRDEIVDDDDGPASGKKVSTDQTREPLFLVPASVGLKPGKVRSVALPESPSWATSISLVLDAAAGPASYLLGVRRLAPGEEGPCELVLSLGGVAQRLVRYTSCGVRAEAPTELFVGDDARPEILWAGDLDGDDRLDLLIDATDHYNVQAPTLFLSSPAAEGELVAPAAQHHGVGC